jgi:hypothetical protein
MTKTNFLSAGRLCQALRAQLYCIRNCIPDCGIHGAGAWVIQIRDYLQPAQEEDEQPPQPELPRDESDDEPPEPLPMPNRDMSFSVFWEPHFSQETSGFDPKTSFSKSAPQASQ